MGTRLASPGDKAAAYPRWECQCPRRLIADQKRAGIWRRETCAERKELTVPSLGRENYTCCSQVESVQPSCHVLQSCGIHRVGAVSPLRE